jgi:hypothetical protein
MAYSLAVFEPKLEFRDRQTFVNWWEERTAWRDGLNYYDPANTTPKLRAWFNDMIEIFPPLNGPLSKPNVFDRNTGWEAEYTIAHELISVGVPTFKASMAYETSIRLAAKHSVGLFEASESPSAAHFPRDNGTMEKANEGREVPRWIETLREEQEKNGIIYVDSIGEVFEKMIELRHMGTATPAVRLRHAIETFPGSESKPATDRNK